MSIPEEAAKQMVEGFFNLAMNDADEALRVINEFIAENPGVGEVPATRAMRSFAAATKASKLFRDNGDAMTDEIRMLCELSIVDLRYAQEKDASFRTAALEEMLDTLAEAMEPAYPAESKSSWDLRRSSGLQTQDVSEPILEVTKRSRMSTLRSATLSSRPTSSFGQSSS